MSQSGLPRRSFLGALGAGGIAAALPAGKVAEAYPANDSVRVGCIGTGGRALGALMPALKEVPGVRLVAVCDIWDRHLEEARKQAEPGAAAVKDFRRLLESKEIDAVLIATPDHLHVPITVAACEAGKDVYVEKPLTHDFGEGAAVIDAQNRHRRIVQVGMQQRSLPQFIEAFDIVRSGKLGKVHKVHLTWNRNQPVGRRGPLGIDPASVDWKAFLGAAPAQPFDEWRFRSWRWFWDFGGGILTDLMVHFIDVANWYLDLAEPESAVAIGDHFRARGAWETPDTIQCLLRYPAREVQVYFEGTFVNARNRAMLEFMGTDATLYLDRGRYEVIPENERAEKREKVLGEGGRGQDFYGNINDARLHLENWIDCVRSRKPPCAPAEAGVVAVYGAHLGNRAYRKSEFARWGA